MVNKAGGRWTSDSMAGDSSNHEKAEDADRASALRDTWTGRSRVGGPREDWVGRRPARVDGAESVCAGGEARTESHSEASSRPRSHSDTAPARGSRAALSCSRTESVNILADDVAI